MLNEQQLNEALAFQAFKAMQYELIAARLDAHCKQLDEALALMRKQNEEQQQLLQRPDQAEELSAEIDLLKQSNADLALHSAACESALRCIAYVEGPREPRDIAREVLEA